MDFATAIRTCFQKYADFNGRATRPEFWYFVLFNAIVQIVIGILAIISENLSNMLSLLYGLAALVPSLAVGARRLHDTDKSGWLQLLSLIPLVGIIVLIVFWAKQGTEGANRFDAPAISPAA